MSGTSFVLCASELELRARLVGIVRESKRLMSTLVAARELGLASWCIGAGAVRNLVWDAIHDFEAPSPLSDVDLVYFDASNLKPERDVELQEKLTMLLPGVPWEVTNQAAVHLWYGRVFGQAAAPLASLEEGVASWPEYATAVGVAIRADNSLQVIAPHGLQDLFAGLVRHNPARASISMYRERVACKRFSERWPKVQIVQA